MPESDEYHRGHQAGGIAERLDSHDRHFAAINGSLDTIAAELAKQTLAIQRLADQAVADATARIATAKALRDVSEQRWTPKHRIIAVVVALAAVATVAVSVVSVAWR